MPPPYLVGLRLAGRRVLVVGGGRVAGRRVPTLLAAGADVVVVSPDVAIALDDLAARGRLRWYRRSYRRGDLEGAWFVQACTDDSAVNEAVAREAESRGVWCVRADDARASAAWTAASGHENGVTVGVLAEGTDGSGDPGRAADIRDIVTAGLRDGTVAARRGRNKRPGVALVGGGPGDAGLVTVRGRQLLARADVVVVDRLAPRELLDELPPSVEIVDAAKIPYGRAVAQEHINTTLVEHAKIGRFVVRLKGGDPFVFGRGAEELRACVAAGVPVEVVPGVTSATAVPAAAGIPVTHRGVVPDFHVVSAHMPPDDPRSTVDWPSLARSRGTLVLLMAVEHIDAIAQALMRYGRNPDTPVAVVRDGTLPSQRTLYATLATVPARAAAGDVRPPAIVVVGEVVHVARETEMLREDTGQVP